MYDTSVLQLVVRFLPRALAGHGTVRRLAVEEVLEVSPQLLRVPETLRVFLQLHNRIGR